MKCNYCNSENCKLVLQEEEYEVKGQKIKSQIKQYLCNDCNEIVFDYDTEQENMLAVYNEYRRINGLLLPEEIKAIRKKYNLSQRSFALLLGMGEKTITRYENGAVQESSQDNLMRLVEIEDNFKIIWNKNKNVLSTKENEKLQKIFGVNTDNKIISLDFNYDYSNCNDSIYY